MADGDLIYGTQACLICAKPLSIGRMVDGKLVPLAREHHLCDLHAKLATPLKEYGARQLDKDGRVVPWEAPEATAAGDC